MNKIVLNKNKQMNPEYTNKTYWVFFRLLIKHQHLIYTLLCFFFLVISCKKQTLKGDAEKLVGNWKRLPIMDTTNPSVYLSTFDSEVINLIITKNGKYEIKKSTRLLEKGKIYLKPYTESIYWNFSVTFDKKAAPLPMAKPRFESHSLIKLKHRDTLILTEYQGYSYQNIHTFILQ